MRLLPKFDLVAIVTRVLCMLFCPYRYVKDKDYIIYANTRLPTYLPNITQSQHILTTGDHVRLVNVLLLSIYLLQNYYNDLLGTSHLNNAPVNECRRGEGATTCVVSTKFDGPVGAAAPQKMSTVPTTETM